MNCISVSGPKELSEHMSRYSEELVILYFFSEDSPECKQMNDVIAELINSTDSPSAIVLKLDASKESIICNEYEVTSAPTFIYILDGDIVDKFIGANVPAFTNKLHQHAKLTLEQMNERLKTLINKAPIMLFMKGNPDAPRCGFSKQVTALLNSYNAKYETFDILEDYDVREGLKKYSNWPTYPQLYVKGELIGGLDILKQLAEGGELQSVLET